MRKSVGLGLVLAAMLGGLPALAQQPHARPDLLLREVVSGMPRGEQQEVRIMTATFQPGQSTVFHTHRFPVAVYVLEGAFTLDLEGREPVTVRTGEAMLEPPNIRMTGHNREAGPTRVVIFYVSDPDTPFLDLIHR